MSARIGGTPAAAWARDVGPGDARAPGRRRAPGRLLDGQLVRVAAVVVHVVDERDVQLPAQRQEILDGIHAIVVLEGNATASTRAQSVEVAREALERSAFTALGAAAVERELLRADPLGDEGLVFELGEGSLDDVLVDRSKNDKLIGVKAQPDSAAPGTRSGIGERGADRSRGVDLLDRVAELWMRVEREDLAVDAERADAVGAAPVDGAGERACIVERQVAQKSASVFRFQAGDVGGGRRAESDRLGDERAAQPELQ